MPKITANKDGGFASCYLNDELRTNLKSKHGFDLNKASEIITQNNINNLSNNSQNNQTITLTGHSAGARRSYLSFLNSNQNQFLDNQNNPAIQALYYGAPANDNSLQSATTRSGAAYLGSNQNAGDGVSYILGGNGGVVDLGWSLLNLPSLGEPIVSGKFVKIQLKSPHSLYIRNK
jgi:hypothetical protein